MSDLRPEERAFDTLPELEQLALYPNKEFWPAYWLLTCDLLRDRAIDHIDTARHWIDGDALLEQAWSSGERMMVSVAFNLFSGLAWDPDLCPHGWATLSLPNWRRLMEALGLARGVIVRLEYP